MQSQVSQSAQVHYRIDVIDVASGRVVTRGARRRNLILDQGLDGLAVRTWSASFTHAAIGTGTTPTKRDSGSVTVSRSGTTLTASAGFFEADDVGRLFKFDTGEEVRITAYSSATVVTTADSGAIAAAEGTIWYVNQSGLVAETQRTGSYSTDSGANGTTFAGGVVTHKRTFIFPAVAAPVTIREIGWAHTATVGGNLFGRDLLAGVGVTLLIGQQLRVVVELTVTFSPAAPIAYMSVATGGWTSDGQQSMEHVGTGSCSIVNTNGTASGSEMALEPATTSGNSITIGESTAALSGATTTQATLTGTFTPIAMTRLSYAAGSFFVDRRCVAEVSQANSTALRSLWLALSSTNRSAFRVLLDNPETKTSSQTLTVTFRLSWGRVLNNA